MSISAVHPQYSKFLPIWLKLNDVFEGQDKIKEERQKYLPPLHSMEIDGMNAGDIGLKRYEQYILRANFPDDYSEAVRNNHGLLWSKPATIELPPGMEYMKESATRDGMGIQALLAAINEMQLRNGRVGLLLDMSSVASSDLKPFISVYYAPSIRNWDTADRRTDGEVARDSLNMVVLDESGPVRQEGSFEWEDQIRRRVLLLGPLETDDIKGGDAVYSQGLFIEGESSGDFDKAEMFSPKYRGETLKEIPFVAINASDCLIEPDVPPLMGLANLVLSMYITEADYRQHLATQGTDTLVRIGAIGEGSDDGAAPVRVGANSVLDVGMGGDAKYVGIESKGLEEQRLALQNDKAEAQLKAGQMVNNTKGSQESGEALRTRIGARTASLVQLAKTGASGLESLLKLCARWMGEDESKVVVKPNLDFSKALFSGQNLVQTMAARQLGAPVSLETIHGYLADQGLTSLTFNDEMEKMKAEIEKYPFILELGGKADQNAQQQAQGNKVNDGGIQQPSQKQA